MKIFNKWRYGKYINGKMLIEWLEGQRYGYTKNHKDENKLNNNVDNLEWCTKAYNNSYGTKAKRQSETRKKLFREGKLKVWNKK